MVAALREAAKGKPVGVLDLDVHFATGSQRIAMRWNQQKEAGEGRVTVVDVYAAMGPPARFVDRVQAVQREHAGLDAASLKEEMRAEFASARPHEEEVIEMACDSHLLFPHDREELDDAAILWATERSVEHFVTHGVETVFVSLGLDAAAGDREGAQVSPQGFKNSAAALRRSGFNLVFALEGGYHVGDLDVAVGDVREAAGGVDADRFVGTGSFGKCVHAVAMALVEN